MNRPEFVNYMGLCAAAVGCPLLAQRAVEGVTSPTVGAGFVPDVELELVARPAQHQVVTGRTTDTWSYSGRLLKGRVGVLAPSGSYLGPTIRARKGDKVRVHFRNELPEPSIVHWHGLEVPELADGHPRLAIPQGQTYFYEFEVRNRAGQYWYHPHPMGRTGAQMYFGMAGLFFVEDDEESALGLPSGEHEIPIVLQDRSFDANSPFPYISGHMEAMTGFLGDRILVNGSATNELALATAAYRVRALAGSTPLEQWRQRGRWPESFDDLWQGLQERHGRQAGTREMIELLALGKRHGWEGLKQAIEQALALGCSDAAAVRHLLTASDLARSHPEPFDFGGLERYDRPLPQIEDYDLLLNATVAAAEVVP